MPNAPHLDNGAAGRDGAGGYGGDADADVGEDHCCHALLAEGRFRNHFVITAVIIIVIVTVVVDAARGAIASAFRLTGAAGAVR